MPLAHLLVLLVAVVLLAALHLAFAGAPGAVTPKRLADGRDRWTQLLVAAAILAILFALGVVAVPALLDDDEPQSLTQPTVTENRTDGRTTTAVETTTSVATTATAPTTPTVMPTPTPPPRPPRGAVVLARAEVDGATGRLRRGLNRLAERRPVVRAAGRGSYRVVLPGLTAQARRRVALRVTAGADTVAEARKFRSGNALIVRTRDRRTGRPAARNFTLVVYGAKRDLAGTNLPETT